MISNRPGRRNQTTQKAATLPSQPAGITVRAGRSTTPINLIALRPFAASSQFGLTSHTVTICSLRAIYRALLGKRLRMLRRTLADFQAH
jgi:hypothetical protein